MDFKKRLEQAIKRGTQLNASRAEAEAQKALDEQEFQRLHSQYRLELSERIEKCLRQLGDQFPGFRFETIVGEKGWGAAVSRDDLQIRRGMGRTNYFSRLEMVIRPINEYHVLDLAAKGTVRNRELFNRAHYQPLGEVDMATFRERVDLWVLEYAELYAARG